MSFSCRFCLLMLAIVGALQLFLPGSSGVAAQGWKVETTATLSDAGPNFSDNVFASSSARKADMIFSPTAGIAVVAKSGPWTVAINGGLNFERYSRYHELESDTALSSFRAAYRISGLLSAESWTFSSSYAPKWIFSPGMDQFQLRLDDFNLAAVGTYRLGSFELTPSLAARRRDSNAESAEYLRFAASFGIAWQQNAKVTWTLKPSVIQSWYDSSPIVGLQKDVFQLLFEFGAEISLTDQMALNIGFSHITNRSSLPGADYGTLAGGPSLTFVQKF